MATVRTGFLHLVITLAASAVFAQSPSTLSFQGRLTDAGGNAINNASQSMTFALYKGTTKIWEESQNVNVSGGLYNVLLGAVVPMDTIRFNEPIDLGVKVGTDPELVPRTPLVSTATARSLPGLYTFFRDAFGDDGYNLIMGFGRVEPGVAGAVVLGSGREGSPNVALNDRSTIGGGVANEAGLTATVGGGSLNSAQGGWSTIGGGQSNMASGALSTVSGGVWNRAIGEYSAVPGGLSNYALGITSFAAGYKARANHHGSFVWNDRSITVGNDSLLSTDANQFVIRAVNGFGINRAPVSFGIHLKQQGVTSLYGIRTEYSADGDYWDTWVDVLNDYNWAFNGATKAWVDDLDGSYNTFSDAAFKDDIAPYDPVLSDLLKLRPSTYRWKGAPAATSRSVGLIAQEVEPFFPELISEKDGMKGMNYSGLGVVAIKAIQELHALVEAQRERLDRQEAEIERLTGLVNSR